ADIARAATACVGSGFRLAGQSCASVQNIFVHMDVADAFKKLLVERVKQLRVGDPLDPESDLGPVINLTAAQRIEQRIKEAVEAGATCLIVGTRDGMVVQLTVLVKAPMSSPAVCEALFGPVVMVHKY